MHLSHPSIDVIPLICHKRESVKDVRGQIIEPHLDVERSNLVQNHTPEFLRCRRNNWNKIAPFIRKRGAMSARGLEMN